MFSKKIMISAILIAVLVLSIMFTGCGSKETTVDLMPTPKGPDASEKPTDSNEPTAEPEVTPIVGWEQVDLSDTSKPWVKQILDGQLKDIPIYKDEHELFPRIYYEPEAWDKTRNLAELQLVGYITGTDPVYNAIEDLCAEYIKVTNEFDYETYTGNEAEYLYSNEFKEWTKKNDSAEKDRKVIQDAHLVSENKGIKDFREFLIRCDGEKAFVAIDYIVKLTGTPEFMEDLELNEDGTVNYSDLITFVFEDSKWKIDTIEYKKIDRVELQPLAE